MNAAFSAIKAGQPALVLAPMEGVLDAPLRQLYGELGGIDFAVSEFIRVSNTPVPPRILISRVPELGGVTGAAGVPVQVQLLGSDPVMMAETSIRAVGVGARAIDLNFGCPAKTVNRHGGGAALLRKPDLMGKITHAVRSAIGSDVALSAKIRLGWDHADHALEISRILADSGVDWIVVHARTREQGYSGIPCWSTLRRIREGVGVPVVANGDIWNVAALRSCKEITGCNQFMIGRGALADPALLVRAAKELGSSSALRGELSSILPEFRAEEPLSWLPLLQRFEAICHDFGAPPSYVLRRMKQWLGWVGHRNELARPWVEAFRRAGSMKEAWSTFHGVMAQCDKHPICKDQPA